MDPREFLDLAGELATGMREGDWRSAVSRAYYAAFHVARLLQRCGFTVPSGEQAHAYLWMRLSNAGRPDVQRIGSDLSNLRGVRNQADYVLERPFDNGTAVGYVQTAATIIQLLEAVPTTPPVQSQITEALRTYERDVLRQTTWHGPPP